jgi:hypothetical protein
VPRYFFNIHDGKDITDREGVELAGLAEARNQAIVAAAEMIRSDGHTIWDGGECRIDVTDHAGNSVFRLRFSADDHASAYQLPTTGAGPGQVAVRLLNKRPVWGRSIKQREQRGGRAATLANVRFSAGKRDSRTAERGAKQPVEERGRNFRS